MEKKVKKSSDLKGLDEMAQIEDSIARLTARFDHNIATMDGLKERRQPAAQIAQAVENKRKRRKRWQKLRDTLSLDKASNMKQSSISDYLRAGLIGGGFGAVALPTSRSLGAGLGTVIGKGVTDNEEASVTDEMLNELLSGSNIGTGAIAGGLYGL